MRAAAVRYSVYCRVVSARAPVAGRPRAFSAIRIGMWDEVHESFRVHTQQFTYVHVSLGRLEASLSSATRVGMRYELRLCCCNPLHSFGDTLRSEVAARNGMTSHPVRILL